MQRVKRAHWPWKGFKGSLQHRWRQLDQRRSRQQLACRVAMGRGAASRIEPAPSFVFEQATGDQRLGPKRRRRAPIFSQQLCEQDRGVEIDHRSRRASSSAARMSPSRLTGTVTGGGAGGSAAGLIKPRRTASASSASGASSARPALGARSSATMRSRSVTSTISPAAASRTYSLSLFLSVLMPTARMC